MRKINRSFDLFTRLMPLWVVLAGVVGFFRPAVYFPLEPYTEWAFGLTMLGIGAVLNFEDFIPVIKRPQLVLLGSLAQFGVMPLAGYLIAKMLSLPDALLIGMVMTGAVPGAMASNVLSYIAKADVAYSISLTTTSTFLSPLLTPALVYLFAHRVVDVKFLAMMLSILKMVILPLAFGFAIKHFFKKTAEGLKQFFPAFSTVFIAFICGLIVALNQKYISSITGIIFAGISLHNLTGLLAGYNLGNTYGFDVKRKRTLSMEVGMQNAGLGAVLSLKYFSSQTALVSALFATWCVITASILAEIWSKKSPAEEKNR